MLSLEIANKEKQDKIISYGEKMSSYLISSVLSSKGIAVKQVIASEFIITNDNFRAADFIPIPTKKKVKKVFSFDKRKYYSCSYRFYWFNN